MKRPGAPRAVSPEHRDAIVAAYAAGASLTEVARQFGVDPSTVGKHVRAAGVPLRRAGGSYAVPGDQRDAIAAAYVDGATLTEVARQFGVSRETVSNYVRAAGAATRAKGPRHTVSDEEADAMVAAYAEGGSINRVAQQFRVARGTVLRRVTVAGVPVRRTGASRKCTPAQVDAIATAYAAGASVGEVAEQFGVSKATVLDYVRASGVPVRRAGGPYAVAGDQRDAIVAAYVDGATLTEVARQFGVSRTTVSNYVRAAGAATRAKGPRHTVSDEEADAMVAAYVAGASTNRIAEEFGLSGSTVRKHVAAAGLPDRRAGGPPRKCTTEQVDAIVAAYAAGGPVGEVAEQFGVDPATVRSYARSAGIATRPPGAPRRLSAEQRDAIVAAYLTGATLTQVGQQFGLPRETVRGYVRDAGHSTSRRPRGHQS